MIFRTPAPGGVLKPDYQLIQGHNRYLQCPSVNNILFSAKLIPHELLSHVEPAQLPPFPHSLSPHFTKFGPEGDKIRYRSNMNRSDTIYASLLFISSKAKVHNHAVKRRITGRRIREALRLIVIRGARASDDRNSIVFNPDDTGEEKWLVKGQPPLPRFTFTYHRRKGWSYVFFPSLEAYRVPWPSLITTVRGSLTKLKASAGNLSNKAMNSRLPKSQARGNGSNRRQTPRNPSSTSPLPANSQNGVSEISRAPRNGARNSPKGIHKDYKPPSARSYTTTVDRKERLRPRKADMRAEVILGAHNYTPFGKSMILYNPKHSDHLTKRYINS